ncbi:MAG TPA: methylmalonyl Co-A mutase-associated GTPase MeaB [Gemmatimonadales bacterium]|nr:methylmalonyl Co-A mutase-associated GTPase MeaB [Gemmatimonadales bacterium]
MNVDRLLERLDARDQAALARAITLVENEGAGFERVLAHACAGLGHARRIGITGPPGAGKSTLLQTLIRAFRAQNLSVAVVAVDPTSPFTGGALLGDRIRMEQERADPHVFIRSMATRGSVGGLATTTEEVTDLLEAFGFERILIETVGVGQTELDVASSADTTVLMLTPESGDGIQTLKAGVMEVADVYVINKSDRPGADALRREVEVMLGLRRGQTLRHIAAHHRDQHTPSPEAAWEPPVVTTVATKEEGIAELMRALDRHANVAQRDDRTRRRLARRTRAVVERTLSRWLREVMHTDELVERELDAVVARRKSPYDVAAEVLEQLRVPR